MKFFSSKWSRFLATGFLLVATLGHPGLADSSLAQSVPLVVQKLTDLYGSAKPPQIIMTQQADPLGHLLALQRRNWSPAWISGTFYDWRTVSQYRRNPGLHLGYDIALPFGTSVSAGWPGVVTAVIPWTDTQYGVSVRSADGIEVTYGHISPLVSPGQTIAAGDTVGRIAADHVDVKMRDGQGRYIPFGEAHSGQGPTLASMGPKVSKNALLTTWLVAHSSAEQAAENYFLARNASQKWNLERKGAERRIETLDKTLAQLKEARNEGLVSRKRLEELKSERESALKTLASVKQRERSTPDQLLKSKKMSEANLSAIAAWAKTEGLGWSDVEALIKKTIAGDAKLKEQVEKSASTNGRSRLTLQQLEAEVTLGATRLAQLEELYLSGGLSRQQMEDQRLKQELLSEELKLRKRRSSL